MTSPMRTVLLLGSPRKRGNSESIAAYLSECFSTRGCQVETLRIHAWKNQDDFTAGMESVLSADLVFFIAPLYVDSLPAPVIEAFERIAAAPATRPHGSAKFAALINCGFPEAQHNDTALRIVRRFAESVGFQWAGGIALGGGESIGGRPLPALGWMTKPLRSGLARAAEALAANQSIPVEVIQSLRKPMLAPWMYIWMGAFFWRRRAKKHGVYQNLNARPYDKPFTL